MNTLRQYRQSVPHYAVRRLEEKCAIGKTDKLAHCRRKTLSWNLRIFDLKIRFNNATEASEFCYYEIVWYLDNTSGMLDRMRPGQPRYRGRIYGRQVFLFSITAVPIFIPL
jgi:hypothetical protein